MTPRLYCLMVYFKIFQIVCRVRCMMLSVRIELNMHFLNCYNYFPISFCIQKKTNSKTSENGIKLTLTVLAEEGEMLVFHFIVCDVLFDSVYSLIGKVIIFGRLLLHTFFEISQRLTIDKKIALK